MEVLAPIMIYSLLLMGMFLFLTVKDLRELKEEIRKDNRERRDETWCLEKRIIYLETRLKHKE